MRLTWLQEIGREHSTWQHDKAGSHEVKFIIRER